MSSQVRHGGRGFKGAGGMRAVAILVVSCMALSSTQADVVQADLLVAARALSFMRKPLVGEVRAGIVYAAENNRSSEDAQRVRKILGDGLKVGNLILKPVLVKVGELGSAQVDLLYLTEGLGDSGARVQEASRARKIPCITVDIPQVKNGTCVMGVRSLPKIEILVNRAAAAASGVEFSTVFRLMITEL